MTKIRTYCSNKRCENNWNHKTFEFETETKNVFERDWVHLEKGEVAVCPLCGEEQKNMIWCYQNLDKKPNKRLIALLEKAQITIEIEECKELRPYMNDAWMLHCTKIYPDGSQKVIDLVKHFRDDRQIAITPLWLFSGLYFDFLLWERIHCFRDWIELEKESYLYRQYEMAQSKKEKDEAYRALWDVYRHQRTTYADLQELFPGELMREFHLVMMG